MIPNTTADVQVSSNIKGASGQFTVDENSLGKIMSVLTNLYTDPEGAVVREYLTNALDSQIEAQENDPSYIWRPIEVTTPSHFSKEYKVRDFGIGMSVDDIKDIYSKYGKSTKESSNSVTGMLGLGSKCALTYTGQFTITGFKNGVRTIATVSINEDHIPEFSILDTRATDEPNGVEISVPVRDRNSFVEKTEKFLKWWKPGQVLVNGREPVHHGLTEVKSGVFLIERDPNSYRYDTPQSYVIMGNVPYAVDAEYVDEHLRSAYLGFAAYVDMAAVDFPPNRERLMYNTRTKKAVQAISEGLFEAILDERVKGIIDAPDFRTAWARMTALESHFSNHPKAKALKYKGHAFPGRVEAEHMELDWDWQGHGQIAERKWLNVAGAMAGTLIVTGVTQGTKPTSYFKKKVKHYIDVNDIDAGDAVLVDADIDNVWFDWIPRIDAQSIKDLKLPKNAGPAGPRVDAPYEFYTVDSKGNVTHDEQTTVLVPAGKVLCHISPQDMKDTYRKSGIQASTFAGLLGEKYVLVVMGKNRFEKFLRTHKSIPAREAVQKQIDEYIASASNAEYLIGKLSYGEQEFMKSVAYANINDPDLADLAKTVQDKSFTANYEKASNLHTMARRADCVTTLPEKKNVKGNPAKRYPLIDKCGGRSLKHMVIYINAVYAAEYAPKKP